MVKKFGFQDKGISIIADSKEEFNRQVEEEVEK